jgi:hypothetical protein
MSSKFPILHYTADLFLSGERHAVLAKYFPRESPFVVMAYCLADETKRILVYGISFWRPYCKPRFQGN